MGGTSIRRNRVRGIPHHFPEIISGIFAACRYRSQSHVLPLLGGLQVVEVPQIPQLHMGGVHTGPRGLRLLGQSGGINPPPAVPGRSQRAGRTPPAGCPPPAGGPRRSRRRWGRSAHRGRSAPGFPGSPSRTGRSQNTRQQPVPIAVIPGEVVVVPHQIVVEGRFSMVSPGGGVLMGQLIKTLGSRMGSVIPRA